MAGHKLLVRADGGPGIGYGHWSRILSVIKYLPHDLQPILFTKYPMAFREAFPDSENLEVVYVDDDDQFLWSMPPSAIVLIDGYFADKSFFDQLKDRGSLVVYIDDLCKPDLQADIVINHAPALTTSQYAHAAPFSAFYLGPSYSMVSDIFLRPSNDSQSSGRDEQLLVCMGGSDSQGLTAQILLDHYEYLNSSYKSIHAIVGKHSERTTILLKDVVNRFPNLVVHIGPTRKQVSDLMFACGAAILPASTMSFEYCHAGGLLILVKSASNQQNIYHGLLSCELAIPLSQLGEMDEFSRTATAKRLCRNQKLFFDGESPVRLTRIFEGIVFQRDMAIRKMDANDAEVAFSWVNDPLLRRFSFTNGRVEWGDHVAWFNKKLEDPNCLYLIGLRNGQSVGAIRFDLQGSRAVTSILVDGSYHGKGVGRVLLNEGIRFLLREFRGVKSIIGEVMANNAASIRLFERFGFSSTRCDGRITFMKQVES